MLFGISALGRARAEIPHNIGKYFDARSDVGKRAGQWR